MSTNAQRSEASRVALLTAAMRRFHDDGYANTRVEDIVEGTAYSKGAFYHHFANKLECFWAVVDFREKLRGSWQGAVAEAPGARSLDEVLRSAVRRLAASEQGAHRWPLVMIEVHRQHRDEEVTARLASVYDRWIKELAIFVDRLSVAGWLPGDIDRVRLARQWLAFGQGLICHAELFSIPPDDMEDLYVEGLVALCQDGPATSGDGSRPARAKVTSRRIGRR